MRRIVLSCGETVAMIPVNVSRTDTHTHLAACMCAHRDRKRMSGSLQLELAGVESCMPWVKQALLTTESFLSLWQGSECIFSVLTHSNLVNDFFTWLMNAFL